MGLFQTAPKIFFEKVNTNRKTGYGAASLAVFFGNSFIAAKKISSVPTTQGEDGILSSMHPSVSVADRLTAFGLMPYRSDCSVLILGLELLSSF